MKKDILASTRELAVNPEMHPQDKYRKNNDGSFRAYELHRYRIACRLTEKEIIIVRVRHKHGTENILKTECLKNHLLYKSPA